LPKPFADAIISYKKKILMEEAMALQKKPSDKK
jgi:hypothetical protein